MLNQPMSHLGGRLTYIAQMRLDVYGALVPERDAVVIDDFERVVREVFGWVGGGLAADVVVVAGELEECGRVVS